MRFPHSIQFRLQVWVGGLVALLIIAFGFSVYRLQSLTLYTQIDHHLAEWVSLVARAHRDAVQTATHRQFTLRHLLDVEERDEPKAGDKQANALPDDILNSTPRPRKGRRHYPPPPHITRDGPYLDTLLVPERPPLTVTLSDDVLKLFADENQTVFAVWDSRQNLVTASAEKMDSLAFIPPFKTLPTGSGLRYFNDRQWRVAYQVNEIGDCILVASNITDDLFRLNRFKWCLILGALLTLGLGLAWGTMLIRISLRPIRRISATAKRIAADNLEERIDLHHMPSELTRLAEVLNHTFARLDAAFERQRQFTADAAHELRNPLAVILSETQMALRREHTSEFYHETIVTCEAVAQDMRKLTESLLLLARLDSHGGNPHACDPIDLAQLIRRAVRLLQPAAQAHDITIHLPTTSVILVGNEDQLIRLFINLIDNAIEYNRPGGEIRITLSQTSDSVIAAVADTGQGIPPGDLPHIFDRFYRSSRSRSREGGHAGIGLALSKAIVETHRGTLRAESKVGVGTTFTAIFPTTPLPPDLAN